MLDEPKHLNNRMIENVEDIIRLCCVIPLIVIGFVYLALKMLITFGAFGIGPVGVIAIWGCFIVGAVLASRLREL